MTTLTTLPEEILLLIFDFVNRPSLKSLRYTCRRISAPATERLFQSILLYPHDKSIDRLVSIANSDTHLSQIPRHVRFEPYQEGHYVIHDLDDPNSPNWGAVSSQFGKLPRLDSVTLHFTNKCPDGSYNQLVVGYYYLRMKIIDDFFGAVVKMAPLPRKLTIGIINEIPPEDSHGYSARIRRVLGRLHTFRLGILCKDLPSDSYLETPSKWLQPAAAALRKLDLMFCGDQPAWSIFSVEDVHFPQLRSLTLRGCTFTADAQVEWILSHADTLGELVLERCRILIHADIRENSTGKASFEAVGMKFTTKSGHPNRVEGMYGMRWNKMLALFGERLGQLRRFRMGWNRRDADGWCEDTMPVRSSVHPCRYASYCEWYADQEEGFPYDGGIERIGRTGVHWSVDERRILARRAGGGRSPQYQQDHEALVELLRRIGD
ncbi:hypothetical protein BDW42DRAFT_199214 [Aspergillus taichungensis]|uniref:F-box domain-containing protein n=1 Tax=Aspergillus taichungensis TaxID=482145 RepID=A0A2J5I490_9EURO|nr:hypothetical protein BDW42DRAFT_199214 [Aspergillus taichungensis]